MKRVTNGLPIYKNKGDNVPMDDGQVGRAIRRTTTTRSRQAREQTHLIKE